MSYDKMTQGLPFGQYTHWYRTGDQLEPYNRPQTITRPTTRPNLKPGQTWFYKLPGAVALSEGWISDLTQHTVEIRRTEWSTSHTRYQIDDLVWVEQVLNPEVIKAPYPGAVTLSDYIKNVQENS